MISRSAGTYQRVAEAAWRWVLDQVRWEDGLWVPETVSGPLVPKYRDGMYSGIGGLGHVLAEIRLSRPWTAHEQRVADAVVQRLRGAVSSTTDCTYFNGLVSTIGVLSALDADGVDAAVARLAALATADGWPQETLGPPRFRPGTRVHDVSLGTAGVLLGALWAARTGVTGALALAEHAADVLLAEREDEPTGTNWRVVPRRFRTEPAGHAPNFSHGLAGIATALALGGTELDRPDLVHAAAAGAEHLVTLGRSDGQGFVVPLRVTDHPDDEEEFSYGWCHGPTGTSLLFPALHRAGVTEVAGTPPMRWHRRCLHSVRTSGLPARLHPGFWDNDGRCCGTAGVGEAFLDSWHRSGDDDDLEFALHLADTLVDRAVIDDSHAYWRFIEHRATEPLLPAGVGWMQGAAGIAAFLFRADRVLREGSKATAVHRMDNWWALPEANAAVDE